MRVYFGVLALIALCIVCATLLLIGLMADTASASIKNPQLELESPPAEGEILTVTEVIAKYGKEGLHKYRLPIPKNAGNFVPMGSERMYEISEKVQEIRERSRK